MSGFRLLRSAFESLARMPKQFLHINPFEGDDRPSRVPLLMSSRPTVPFPHPWNYRRPIEILETYFSNTEHLSGAAKHNRYLDVPGMPPVLVTRDPAVIRSVLTTTGERDDQFDRDPLPSSGIARATGDDTLLFGNGAMWKRQRKVSASPFGKTSLFQVDVFLEFEDSFRRTVQQRLSVLREHLEESGAETVTIALEAEIKVVMLQMLTECFFGTEIDVQELRDVYLPTIERVIDHIVRDTVINRVGIPRSVMARLNKGYADAAVDLQRFDELVDRVLESRHSGRGLWKKFKSDAADSALRSNIRVFLAGALEATTSFATWAVAHLARNEKWQQKVFEEVESMSEFTPEKLKSASSLNAVLDETLRLTPSLYFLPRRATARTSIRTSDGREMVIPKHTHILLDVWHANRVPEFWGEAATGFPADQFFPERWQYLADSQKSTKDFLHFGFGHGARVCPGKHLGQLEVALVVGAIVKLFQFRSVKTEYKEKAGVSTKPDDGALVELQLREPTAGVSRDGGS